MRATKIETCVHQVGHVQQGLVATNKPKQNSPWVKPNTQKATNSQSTLYLQRVCSYSNIMSRQLKPNARDNNDEEDGGAPAARPNRDGFGNVFQSSIGSGIDSLVDDGMMPSGGTGLPPSASGLTQARAPHGREAAGTTRYVT